MFDNHLFNFKEAFPKFAKSPSNHFMNNFLSPPSCQRPSTFEKAKGDELITKYMFWR